MDDAESLFGSPPSSPTRGRSPSPALALPSVSRNIINFTGSSAQNVGTIALPGSQHFSELPVNPLALSLSYPPSQYGDASRPPAQQRSGFMTHVRPHIPASSASVPPPSLTRRKTTKKPQAKTKTSARPAPPPIHLPDPSQSDPLPPNLLRNQPGLLGTAGVVAGVRPAHLPARSAPARSAPPVQGATSSNPIFVDDDVRPPPVSRFKRLPRVNVDPSQLPPPSNQDIVSTLIRQRDIFPVLEHILKFIAAQTPPSSRSNFSRSQSRCSSDSRSHTPSDEPKKRRKLRQVPAGAALWDVPFPFNEGEGPDTYRDDWEKDRGKKLIADLVAVIKGAARKAAVQNHLDKTQEEKRQAQEEQRKIPTEAELASIGKHYRVDTLFYGPATKSSEPEVLADASYANRPSVTPSFDPSHPPSPPQASVASAPSIPTDPPSQSTPFDQLISSLLSASSNEQLSMASDNSTPDAFFDPSSPLDPGLFDSWMDIFQTFPVPPEGFTPDFKADDYHIDPRETFLTMPESMRDTQSPPMPFDFSSDVAHAFPEPASSHPTYSNPTFEDLMIDPALLSLSTSTSALPGPSASGSMSHFSDSGCPSLVGSPIPSVSSSSFGPMTPTEMGWNGDAESGVYSPVQDPVVSSAEGSTLGKGKGKKRDFSDMSEWTDAEKEALYFLEVLSQSKTRPKGKGKSKADRDSSQDSSQDGPDAPGRDEGKESDVQFSKVPTVPIVGALAKAEVLKRAKERREELSREIERTRIALWETTIEGGVLAGLVQHYGKGCSEV